MKLVFFKYRIGKIVVRGEDFRVESSTDFEFVDPSIIDFSPKVGPVSGGTLIKIIGNYLNAVKHYVIPAHHQKSV